MSLDYLVITTSKASTEKIEQLCSRYKNCSFKSEIEGKFILGEVDFEKSFICSIVGPKDFESSEISDVMTAVEGAKYLYEVGAPTSLDEEAEEIVIRICCTIAESGCGIAIDLVSGEVFYAARAFENDGSINSEKELPRFDLLTISFIFRPENFEGMAPKFLDLLETHCPLALPKTLDCMHYNKKKKMHNEIEFIELWSRESSSDYGGNVSWTGSSPFLSGDFVFERKGPLDEDVPSRYSKRHYLDLNFNGSLLCQKPDESSKMVQLLIRRITEQFKTIYAAAYIQRDYGLGKNTYWFSKSAESFRIDPGFWAGIPNFPSWLTWFGPEYYPIVFESVKSSGNTFEKVNEGLLLKMGDHPMNKDELLESYPKFPKRYVVPAAELPKFDLSE